MQCFEICASLRFMPITIDQARAAKEHAKAALALVPGVVGIGLTRVGDDYALKVNLRAALPEGMDLPATIAGVPLQVEVVGSIRRRG